MNLYLKTWEYNNSKALNYQKCSNTGCHTTFEIISCEQKLNFKDILLFVIDDLPFFAKRI